MSSNRVLLMNVVRRARRKLRSEGWGGVLRSIRWRLGLSFPATAWWGQLGPISESIVRRHPIRQPVILVISYSRSGSSWVGETLGHAPDTLYLFEPLREAWRAHGGEYTTFHVDPANPPPIYDKYARKAFAAIPAFNSNVVRNPGRWGFPGEGQRRLVIKEVNPFALSYIRTIAQPRVLFLVRHPVATILSHIRLKWYPPEELNDWRKHGQRIGHIHSKSWKMIEDYPDKRLIRYEDLCRNPVAVFRDLYEYCGLEWTSDIEQRIQKKTRAGDRADTFATSRDTEKMLNAWREEIGVAQVRQLRDGYEEYDLPFYRGEADW